jgi:hypothetical protein
MLNGSDQLDSARAPAKKLKPTINSRTPVRFSGRRVRAIRPAATNAHPIKRPKTLVRICCSSCSLARTRASVPPPAASATGPTVSQTRAGEFIPIA